MRRRFLHRQGHRLRKGACPECSTKLFRMGRTDAHEGLTPPEVQPRKREKQVKRSGKLVIVESPAKARTVGRFLGKGYTVKASVGHVRDLLRSQLSVDVENNFQPKYRVPNEKRPVVKELKVLAQKSNEIYLATDLDREGEAIAWHLMESAEIDPKRTKRVVFHEITRPAIEESFAHPREYQYGFGGCPARAPDFGSSGRLQHQPALMAQGARPSFCWTGAVGGFTFDCGA